MVDLNQFKLIKQGAEARLYTGTFLDQDVLTKERHKSECRALLKCKTLGVPVPTMYLCDNETNVIVMERFKDAVTVRDRINNLLNEKDNSSLEKLARSIGSLVAKIHSGGLIHGDITTSNIMVDDDDKLYFIDFGLSFQEGVSEDKGVDLYVLERALVSTHPNTEALFQTILESYKSSAGSQGPEVIKKFEEIRQRGRKRTMLG